MTSPERLSALDVAFLHMERPGLPMHVASVATFEGGPLHDPAGTFRLAAVRAEVAARLDDLPRLRRRIVWPPLGLARPWWVDDPAFDVARHVDVVDLGAGDEEALRRCAEELVAEPLPRDRPLWHLRFVTGLADGSVALVERVHHALVDGVSGVDVAAVLLDVSATAPRHGPVSWEPERPAPGALLVDIAGQWATVPMRVARGLTGVVVHPGALGRHAAAFASGLATAAADGLLAPPSPLNEAVGPGRRLDWVRLRLDDARAAGGSADATVNDVVLTAVADGLRHLLVGRGDPLPHDASAKVLVPVSLRDDAGHGALGNRVGALLVRLPIGIGDAPVRLAAVAAATARLKRRREAEAAGALLGAADALPALLLGPLSRLVHRQGVVNLVVTNVPGPAIPLYALGARMTSAFPVVPLNRDLALGVAILSYDGVLHLGITADGAHAEDLERFRSGLEHGLAALGVAPLTEGPAAVTAPVGGA